MFVIGPTFRARPPVIKKSRRARHRSFSPPYTISVQNGLCSPYRSQKGRFNARYNRVLTILTCLTSTQSASPIARSSAARFASTAAKQPTLKERLAEIIPAAQEHVCLLYLIHQLVSISDTLFIQVKSVRAEHGKKSFGPVVVDQLFGCVPSHTIRHLFVLNK